MKKGKYVVLGGSKGGVCHVWKQGMSKFKVKRKTTLCGIAPLGVSNGDTFHTKPTTKLCAKCKQIRGKK